MTDEAQGLRINTGLMARAMMASMLGMQFGGERDVWEAAGYDRLILPRAYVDMYRRGDIAQRIVNIFADETWRLAPALVDGEDTLASNPNNQFLAAWEQLAMGGQLFEDGETQAGLLSKLHYLDQL